MAWNTKHLILALTMVVMGSINTLSSSWADNTKSIGSDGEDRPFDHPFFQTWCLFFGEMLCFVCYGCIRLYKKFKADKLKDSTVSNQDIITETGQNNIPEMGQGLPSEDGQENNATMTQSKEKPRYNPFVFLVPSLCEVLGFSLMYIGLVMTYPSSYQMLRGSIIIFTGLMSVAFLGRTLRAFQWIGMIVVMVGLVLTGLADILVEDVSKDVNSVITGDLLIIIAQIISATDMILEERYLTEGDVHPLVAVGSEGVWGFVILGIALIPMYFIHVPASFSSCPEYRLEDVKDAFVQMSNSWQVCLGVVGSIIAIAFTNFAGVSVTKEISATTRTMLDSICTLVIWLVSLGVGWENFQYLQVVGYIVLVLGMFIYHDMVFTPFFREKGWLNCKSCQPVDDEDSTSNIAPSTNSSEVIENGDIHLVNVTKDIENEVADPQLS